MKRWDHPSEDFNAYSTMGGDEEAEIDLWPATLTIRERDSDRSISVRIHLWKTVRDLKQLLRVWSVPESLQQLFVGGAELSNRRSLLDCGLRHEDTILLAVRPSVTSSETALLPYGALQIPPHLFATMEEVRQAMVMGLAPKRVDEGTGGTYMLRGRDKDILAVFKPLDEEAFAPNNPRQYKAPMGSVGFRSGVLSGEAGLREVAAYILDRGFAGVPETTLVEAQHPAFNNSTPGQLKLGSFQEFVVHDDVAGDLSPSLFPTKEVHKIAILDIRLLNADRNDANILVRGRRTYRLIPIDHGLTLPGNLDICEYDLTWMQWPQVHEPLDSESLAYIASLDPLGDAEMLEMLFDIRPACIAAMRVSTMLLQKGAAAGLTLFEIGSILYRADPGDGSEKHSELESLVMQANRMAEQDFEKRHSNIHLNSSNGLLSNGHGGGNGNGNGYGASNGFADANGRANGHFEARRATSYGLGRREGKAVEERRKSMSLLPTIHSVPLSTPSLPDTSLPPSTPLPASASSAALLPFPAPVSSPSSSLDASPDSSERSTASLPPTSLQSSDFAFPEAPSVSLPEPPKKLTRSSSLSRLSEVDETPAVTLHHTPRRCAQRTKDRHRARQLEKYFYRRLSSLMDLAIQAKLEKKKPAYLQARSNSCTLVASAQMSSSETSRPRAQTIGGQQ